jgi:metal-responsive CopG/Arc/MetJ family transcriptional regulator
MKTEKRLRAPDAITITVSLKRNLRDQVDAAAKAVQRSRSNYIAKVLTDAVIASEAQVEAQSASGSGSKK